MTTTLSESPQVELLTGLQLGQEDLIRLTARNPSPIDSEETWRRALMEWRAYATMRGRAELSAMVPEMIDAETIRTVMHTLWGLFFPHWTKATVPMIAEGYIQGFNMVSRDEVPIQMIYRLADEHANQVGTYFNESSTEAMIQGFEKFVNKQVPRRVAMERALESYGLTPRQTSGYVAAEQLWPKKVDSATPISVKAKIKEYVSRSFQQRLGVFAKQEHHNLDMQAQQVAWMWMVENGKISESTKKMWITAKDEKVCKVCGPMNSKKVGVRDKFELPDGNELFVPGAHVNCRCVVKLWVNPYKIEKISKADWDPKEHPRGGDPSNPGRFSRRAAEPEVKEQERSEVLEGMLRQVREMQEQEAVKEAVEEAVKPAEKPKATFGPSAVFTDKPKAVFVEQPKEEPKPRASFQVEKPKAQFETEKPVAGFWERPKAVFEETKPKAEFDLERIVQEERVRQTAEQEEGIFTVGETVTYVPTRKLYGRNDEPGIGTTIVDAGQLTLDQDEVTILDGTEDKVRIIPAHLKERRMATMIHDAYDRQVGKMVWDKTSGAAEVEVQDSFGPAGREIVAYVPVDIVTQAAELALKMPDNPMEASEELDQEGAKIKYDTAFKLQWMYADSNEYVVERNGDDGEGEEMSWRELIQYLGFEKSDYQVVVVNVPEGYGNAYRLDEETWATPGRYTAANARQKFIEGRGGLLIPYLEVDARPNVQSRTETVYGGITPEIIERWKRRNPGKDWPYG